MNVLRRFVLICYFSKQTGLRTRLYKKNLKVFKDNNTFYIYTNQIGLMISLYLLDFLRAWLEIDEIDVTYTGGFIFVENV